jgi:uncharacterized protein YceH (UPF0502 family)
VERRPGQKEERYGEILQQDADESTLGSPAAAQGAALADALGTAADMPPEALEGLEERVARLEREVSELRAALAEPVGEPAP